MFYLVIEKNLVLFYNELFLKTFIQVSNKIQTKRRLCKNIVVSSKNTRNQKPSAFSSKLWLAKTGRYVIWANILVFEYYCQIEANQSWFSNDFLDFCLVFLSSVSYWPCWLVVNSQLETEKLFLVDCWAVWKIQVECAKAVLLKTIMSDPDFRV